MKREMMNMIDKTVQRLVLCVWPTIVPVAILALWISIGAFGAPAQQSDQPTYSSAAEASQDLFQAVQTNNEHAIAKILGGPTDLSSSANGAQDKVDRELFVQKYQEMHRLHRDADGSVTLYIGAENWPFPIPLIAKNGAWQFDPETGTKEVMFRRIGDNELTAIATCHEFVAAERHYPENPAAAEVAGSSPASLVAKAAKNSGGGDPVLFHGYYFRALPVGPTKGANQRNEDGNHSRFVLMAYPAEYKSSGVMTFVVTENGVVYERDLGTGTSALAAAMTTFHKDASWHPAND
jgi:hypothetical protein